MSFLRRKANRRTQPTGSIRKSLARKEVLIQEDLTSKTKDNGCEIVVSESDSEDSIKEWSRRKSQRLNATIAETTSEDSSSPRRRRLFPIGSQGSDYTDESESEYFEALEDLSRDNGSTEKDSLSSSSRSTDDVEDQTPVYCLQTALVPLKDIGGLLQSYSMGKFTKGLMFRIKTCKLNGQSASSSSIGDLSSHSDPKDSDFSLSESSTSDSEDSSTSGSSFSWDSECESISSSNSWLPRRYISSSEEDSDTKSENLEELEDDFILHTNKNRELRKRKYSLRKRNSAIRKKIAKYCDELSSDESTDSSDD